MNGCTEIPIKIWSPFGNTYKTLTITSYEESIGNDIAEGRLHKSMFWPELAKSLNLKFELYNKRVEKSKEKNSRLVYASGWINEYLNYYDDYYDEKLW